MNIKTGETVYELIMSIDSNNNPQTAATFTTIFYKNGNNISITPTISLVNSNTGLFSFSWSASTYGVYQSSITNNLTNVIYISDTYYVKPDNEIDPSPNIYVGL